MSKRFPGRRLSWVRLTAVVAGLGLATAAGASGFRTIQDSQTATGKSWFAGYVDVTATPRFDFEKASSRAARDVVLSFIVAGNDAATACTPTWGAAYTLGQAGASLDLDRRIARLRQGNGSIVVSFGGQRNNELAASCTDPAALKRAYLEVIDRYELTTIDLDLEGEGLANVEANRRRAAVLAEIQRERKKQGHELAVWLTLPVAANTGLTEAGTSAVAETLNAKLKVAGVNVMTMDFGESRNRQQSMAEASISALEATHRQLTVLHRRAGDALGPATTWKRMGATPMLGQNDVPSEVFTVEDARKLSAYALDKGLGRMSVWSLNRDRTCGSNYADVKTVSVACSGIDQGSASFARLLGRKFTGVPDLAGADPRVPEPKQSVVVDDPKSSPYAIWNAGSAYLQGTKVVWKRNVYVAKWWTRGDLPDNPVLQPGETPWTLVGPVLAGEKPIEPVKIAAMAYPRWQADRVYRRGDRVLFEGIGYEAKWWTQRDNPQAGAASPDASPWIALTDEQVRQVNTERAKRRAG